MRTVGLTIVLLLVASVCAQAAVDVSVPAPQVTKTGADIRTVQQVTFANEACSYTLVYDFNVNTDRPGEATSKWWGAQQGFIPIGMTEPSMANWYWQAFVNWVFDDEDLSKRPATMRVVRSGGPDGVVEFAWDTPKVKASLYFALASGSDKLLLIGRYEPKTSIKESRVTLVCYPGGFEQPHNRAVTTATGTRRPGDTAQLDPARQRWVLYEDTTPNRPGCGSAGLVIGTPEAFRQIRIPVGDYGITTALTLKPEARGFGLGLYDFPAMPDYEQTRAYFRASADAEAGVIGRAVAAGIEQVALPAMPVEPARLAALRARNESIFQRGTELWRPNPEPLAFPWARKLSGGPIHATLFVPRYRAWETMELARRLDMRVKHLYFDSDSGLARADNWPYAATTGQGALPYGLAMQQAVRLAEDPEAEVIICASVNAGAIPTVARRAVVEQVAAGKGLLLVGPSGKLGAWDQALFATKDAAATQAVLANLAWDSLPGFGEGERGRGNPVVDVYTYGKGKVVVLRVNPTAFGCLAPANDAAEGLDGALDRSLAVAARAVLAAAGRSLPCSPALRADPQGQVAMDLGPRAAQATRAVVRVQDDLDRTLAQDTVSPVGHTCALPPLPAGRRHYVDIAVLGSDGSTLGYSFMALPETRPLITALKLSPAQQAPSVLTPKVTLPQGGTLTVSADVVPSNQPLTARCEVRDAFERVLARQSVNLPAGARQLAMRLTLARPVTVSQVLDLWLQAADKRTVAYARQRFAMDVPYPYDDFTGLLWSYAGGDPVLQRTDRLCYEWGADLSDLCHMMGRSDNATAGGYTDAGAAREYSISARSGLRLIPYVTRIAGESNEKHERTPCLHDPQYLQRTKEGLVRTCRQAAPYSPAAYTLGDENYLSNGQWEVCHRPASIAAFQAWLRGKYQTIDRLNAAWGSSFSGFDGIAKPMTIDEAAGQQASFAPWIDHKLFMNEAFADTHDQFAAAIQTVDPRAKVGYDGFLGFDWQSGYDFERLGRNLRLNQTYTVNWLQGQLARDFRQPGALSGAWGNSDADTEEGWHAFPWHCLLNGDNSVWWWTSWGCDYIPFNPDTSQSNFGKWFYESLTRATQGPGKLLLHAQRDDSGVAVLHSEPDMMAAAVAGQMKLTGPFAGDNGYLAEETAILHGLQDMGLQTTHVGPKQLAEGKLDAAQTKLLWLPFASCVSDEMAANLRRYVEAGGTLVVDGRAGLLTGDGKLRATRALDELLGVQGEAGLRGWQRAAVSRAAGLPGYPEEVSLLEPGLKVTTGQPTATPGGTPVVITNRVGKGVAITLNMALASLGSERTKPGLQVAEALIGQAVKAAGLKPFSSLQSSTGDAPLCLQQTGYTDGELKYLALLQDFRVRGLVPQKLHLTLPRAGYVYEVLSGKRVGPGKVQSWDVTIGRGYPLLYALLPYEVTAVAAAAPQSCPVGTAATVHAAVKVSAGKPGYHVIRLDVYAPGASTPHRQYSQNVACPTGQGTCDIPFALSDAKGVWRLQWRDVATGVKTETKLTLK